MSVGVISSVKFLKLKDGITEIYYLGFSSEVNRGAQRFTATYFVDAFPTYEDARLFGVQPAETILGGDEVLKDLRNSPLAEQAEVFVRRYERSLRNAKTLHVDDITYDPQTSHYAISWGDAYKDIEHLIGTRCTVKDEPRQRVIEDKNKARQIYDFIKQPVRDGEDVAAISKISNSFGSLLTKGATITEEQLATVAVNSKRYFVSRLSDATTVRLTDKQQVMHWIKTLDGADKLDQVMSDDLTNDCDLMREFVLRFPKHYDLAPVSVRAEREVALKAVASNAYLMHCAPVHLRSDRDFVLDVARTSGYPDVLRHADSELNDDPDFAYQLFSICNENTRSDLHLHIGETLRSAIGEHDTWMYLKARDQYLHLQSTLAHQSEPPKNKPLKI